MAEDDPFKIKLTGFTPRTADPNRDLAGFTQKLPEPGQMGLSGGGFTQGKMSFPPMVAGFIASELQRPTGTLGGRDIEAELQRDMNAFVSDYETRKMVNQADGGATPPPPPLQGSETVAPAMNLESPTPAPARPTSEPVDLSGILARLTNLEEWKDSLVPKEFEQCDPPGTAIILTVPEEEEE